MEELKSNAHVHDVQKYEQKYIFVIISILFVRIMTFYTFPKKKREKSLIFVFEGFTIILNFFFFFAVKKKKIYIISFTCKKSVKFQGRVLFTLHELQIFVLNDINTYIKSNAR